MKHVYLLISINKKDTTSRIVEEAYLDEKKAIATKDLWNEMDKKTDWRYIIDKVELVE